MTPTADMDNQYCFINVGRAGGKVKFCMLDKQMSWIGDKYHLRAVLMTNRNTGNVTVQVLALPKNHMAADSIPDDISQITTIQHLIWEEAYGLTTNQIISHINQNTMDNRINNLMLSNECYSGNSADLLYSSCLQQIVSSLPWMNVPDILHTPSPEERFSSQLFDLLTNHNQTHQSLYHQLWSPLQLSEPEVSQPVDYTECHYLPCTRLEQRKQEFDCCGACRFVKYCSHECQRLDWSTHSLHCDIIISSHLKAHPSEVQQSVQSMNNHRKLTILYETKSYDQEQIITAKQQHFNDDCNSSVDIDR